jgi:esterase/lipase/1-acyl-sn-glycerol-3-phosphate acyltransferase
MERKGIVVKMTKLALNALIKYANADIRMHDTEIIPAQPCIFAINHFTRMETFFMPYLLNKITGNDILSLAHHSLFVGSFGTLMSKCGAISTKDPSRDRLMISGLLKGDAHCMIFPEGQMIKDKKLVEKGKYMIYNTDIRRPPHTGTGILALRAEFFRLKLRHFIETSNMDGIDEIRKAFDLGGDREIEKIITLETHIVPVNITYFPIRARTNIINSIASRFVDKLPERIEEELEVEGTMLVDGVDIDINFGRPISVKEYLLSGKSAGKLRSGLSYASPESMKKELSFHRQALDLMYRYMDSIYGMTTVNHDHIFSYLLTKYRKNRMSIDELKNRAFLAIQAIQKTAMHSHHTFLMKKQGYLLTDDAHAHYTSFIETAKSDGLITEKGGYLYKNADRFSKINEFHTIRKDNILEVLKNEIEPLHNVVRKLDRVLLYPSWLVRYKIRNQYLDLDRDIFERDYQKYHIKNESKPPEIGRPFYLKRLFNRRGVLLIHGYMAAPEEVRKLGEYLHGRGYTVYGVRLRGHGTAPEDLQSREWPEWYESVNRGYVVLKNTVPRMAIGGFSTGAGLALLQASVKKDCFAGIFSINAPLRINNIASKLASTIVGWNSFLDRLHLRRGKMEFVTNDPENRHINYFRNPVRGVAQLEKLMGEVEKALPRLEIPALVVQGSNDPVVNPVSGPEIFEKIGTRKKELCRLYADRHGIINGEGRERVFERVDRFLHDVMR